MTNPFGKISLFRLFYRFVYIVQKSRFFFLPEITKIWGFNFIFVCRVKKVLFSIKNTIKHFSGLFCIKTQDKNLSNFLSNPYPLQKNANFVTFFYLCFRVYSQSCFLSRMSSNTFFLPFLLEIKHERLFNFFFTKTTD